MPLEVVFFDANVLVPVYLRRLFLRLAYRRDLFEARWSSEVLNDVEKALFEDIKLTTEKARSAVDVLRARGGSLVTDFEHRVPTMTNQVNDRSVLATAVHCGASNLVTNNLRHFKAEDTTPHGIKAISPGYFLEGYFKKHRRKFVFALLAETQTYDNPAMALPNLLQAYSLGGATEFAKVVSEQMLGTKFAPRR